MGKLICTMSEGNIPPSQKHQHAYKILAAAKNTPYSFNTKWNYDLKQCPIEDCGHTGYSRPSNYHYTCWFNVILGALSEITWCKINGAGTPAYHWASVASNQKPEKYNSVCHTVPRDPLSIKEACALLTSRRRAIIEALHNQRVPVVITFNKTNLFTFFDAHYYSEIGCDSPY